MKTKKVVAVIITFLVAAVVINGCSLFESKPSAPEKEEMDLLSPAPVEIREADVNVTETSESSDSEKTVTLGKSPADWPRSIWDFKWPFRWIPNTWYERWKITCGYGCGIHHNDPYPGAGWHSVDLERSDGGSTLGSWVLNPARGKVIFAGWMTGYGWCVVMDHDAGHTGLGYKSLVGHLREDPRNYVHVGNDLLQGTILGHCGASGGNYVPHIHFCIYRNNYSVSLTGISGYGSIVAGRSYVSFNLPVRPPFGNP